MPKKPATKSPVSAPTRIYNEAHIETERQVALGEENRKSRNVVKPVAAGSGRKYKALEPHFIDGVYIEAGTVFELPEGLKPGKALAPVSGGGAKAKAPAAIESDDDLDEEDLV